MKTLLLKATVVTTAVVLAIASPAVAQQGGRGTLQAVRPDARAIPGGSAAATLLSGIMWFGLALCAGGFIFACGKMALGKLGGNHHHMSTGGTALAASLGAAFLIAAAFTFVNWAAGLGASVTP